LKAKGDKRGKFPELRGFFERNKIPAKIHEELLRKKDQRRFLGIYERLAGLLNRTNGKKG